jgi:hypothetical protein
MGILDGTPRTQEEIQATIRAARDSVWVINEQLQKLANGATPNEEIKGNLERNTGHLKIVMADPEISGSGEDLSDLTQAITDGDAKLAESIWG